MIKDRIKAAARPILSCLVGVAVSCSAQMTLAGYIGAPATMQSTRNCTYSMQLQNSVSARREYLVKLSAAQGEGSAAGGEVDNMYGNITQASYRPESKSDEEESSVNMWGFEVKEEKITAGIDQFSSACLACHDGVEAIAVAADVRNDPHRKHNGVSGPDHPIGMDYARYAGGGRNFKQVWNDSGKMVFINGKVGCLTCHDPLSSERGRLVMSDRNSALCLTCHNK